MPDLTLAQGRIRVRGVYRFRVYRSDGYRARFSQDCGDGSLCRGHVWHVRGPYEDAWDGS